MGARTLIYIETQSCLTLSNSCAMSQSWLTLTTVKRPLLISCFANPVRWMSAGTAKSGLWIAVILKKSAGLPFLRRTLPLAGKRRMAKIGALISSIHRAMRTLAVRWSVCSLWSIPLCSWWTPLKAPCRKRAL